MNLLRTMTWALLPFLISALPATAQTPVAEIRFTYENPKLQPPRYVITIGENGEGRFVSEGESASRGDSQTPVQTPVMEPQDRAIHVSQALRDSVFAIARKNKLFAIKCENGAKNIAFQGTKTLGYEGPEGKGSCTYNWSNLAPVDKLTDQFQAIAVTLEEGSKLQRQYEHGRLSLDEELEFLTQMVSDGRAIEVQNIAPILQTIAADDAVLKRAQRRAQALLQTGSKN